MLRASKHGKAARQNRRRDLLRVWGAFDWNSPTALLVPEAVISSLPSWMQDALRSAKPTKPPPGLLDTEGDFRRWRRARLGGLTRRGKRSPHIVALTMLHERLPANGDLRTQTKALFAELGADAACKNSVLASMRSEGNTTFTVKRVTSTMVMYRVDDVDGVITRRRIRDLLWRLRKARG